RTSPCSSSSKSDLKRLERVRGKLEAKVPENRFDVLQRQLRGVAIHVADNNAAGQAFSGHGFRARQYMASQAATTQTGVGITGIKIGGGHVGDHRPEIGPK